MKLILTLLIFAAGLAASMTLTARADAVTLADLPALGYTLALQFNAQTQCGNYVVTGGNGAPETLIGDPQHLSCQAPGAIEERIAALLAAYPPASATSAADPVTVTATTTEIQTEFVTTTAPAVTVTQTETLASTTTLERLSAPLTETITQTVTAPAIVPVPVSVDEASAQAHDDALSAGWDEPYAALAARSAGTNVEYGLVAA